MASRPWRFLEICSRGYANWGHITSQISGALRPPIWDRKAPGAPIASVPSPAATATAMFPAMAARLTHPPPAPNTAVFTGPVKSSKSSKWKMFQQ